MDQLFPMDVRNPLTGPRTMRPLSQIEIRDIDRRAIEHYGLPGVVLMENAGRGCAEIVTRFWKSGSAIVLCGKGNNGGDGFVIARHLENAGWRVKVRFAGPKSTIPEDARLFLSVVERGGIDCQAMEAESKVLATDLQQADLIVDALLGTGLTGVVREPYTAWIAAINASGKPILAVDLPSGMDANTGKPLGVCVQATRTATMVSRKLGFENIESSLWTGPIEIVDIGVPRELLRQLDLSETPL